MADILKIAIEAHAKKVGLKRLCTLPNFQGNLCEYFSPYISENLFALFDLGYLGAPTNNILYNVSLKKIFYYNILFIFYCREIFQYSDVTRCFL